MILVLVQYDVWNATIIAEVLLYEYAEVLLRKQLLCDFEVHGDLAVAE